MTQDPRSDEESARAASTEPGHTVQRPEPAVDREQTTAGGGPTAATKYASARNSTSTGDSTTAGGATAGEDDTPATASSRHPVLRFVREVFVIGATALIISFLIKTFIVQAFWIPSGSMESTLIYGDRVLVSKIQAGPMAVDRGDIIVFEDPGGWLPPAPPHDRGPILGPMVEVAKFIGVAPEGDSNHLIKRVIGVGGDHVVCCDDLQRITVNGAPLDETYLFGTDEPSLENFDITVPPESLWMMGDHRSNSRDSRAHDDGTGTAGSVPTEKVVGQAMVLVWPLNRFEVFRNPSDVFGSVPTAAAAP